MMAGALARINLLAKQQIGESRFIKMKEKKNMKNDDIVFSAHFA